MNTKPAKPSLRRAAAAALVSFGLLACGGETDEPTREVAGATRDAASPAEATEDTATPAEATEGDTGPAAEEPLSLRAEDGLVLAAGDREVAWLLPRARIDGTWHEASLCVEAAEGLDCPLGEVATAELRLEDDRARVDLLAEKTVSVEQLELKGRARLPGATAWLSNGFQSWSQSGALALGPAPTPEEEQKALSVLGDLEVLRKGRELSWWHTWVGGGETAIFAGALTSDVQRPWAQVAEAASGDDLILRLGGGGGPQDVVPLKSGERLTGETWWLAGGGDLAELGRRYGEALSSRRASHPVPADAGWNSWYELFDTVDDAAVRANAAIAKELLAPLLPGGAPPLRVVVDDGWQRAWGDWQPNQKFKEGLDDLSEDLREDGFATGVWLAPLLVEEDIELATRHPEWLVEGTTWNHSKHGTMRILDPTHPEAAAHLRATIERIVSWGYDLLKIDFLFTGTFPGGRHEQVTGMQAYHRAMSIIREAAGPDTILLAVGAPQTPSLPYADAWRLGNDIVFENVGASWPFVANQARSVAARWPVCLAILCDPDPPILRTLAREEVEAGSWVVAFAGGALFLSDDLRALPEERRTWGLDEQRTALSIGALPSVPLDPVPAEPPETLTNALFDFLARKNVHVVPTRWRLPDGTEVLFNAADEAVSIGGQEVLAHTALKP